MDIVLGLMMILLPPLVLVVLVLVSLGWLVLAVLAGLAWLGQWLVRIVRGVSHDQNGGTMQAW